MEVRTIIINRRTGNEKQSLGTCSIFDECNRPLFSAISLERGWLDNAKNISCVPKGRYTVLLEYSPRFEKDLWELKNVPNRAECKFHSANYWHQLNGCIALGSRLKDIDKDGYYDVTDSVATMNAFHEALKGFNRVELIIM